MRAVIGLGSNIDAHKNIRLALRLLGRCDGWRLITVSPIYETDAVGTEGPDFVNAAVLVETDLTPEAMRNRLRQLEERMGRVRTEDKFAPRPIDFDIVTFDLQIDAFATFLRDVPRSPIQPAARFGEGKHPNLMHLSVQRIARRIQMPTVGLDS